MDTTAPTIELVPTASATQFTRSHVVAETTETPSLTLRPLKKHTNVRIGAKIDLEGFPSRASLLAISSRHNWFFAGHGSHILASPLSELRTSLGQNSTEEEVTFLCQVKLSTGDSSVPLFLSLTADEAKLVVASSSAVTIWDVNAVINGETNPSHSFALNDLSIVDVHPNPGETPELVAFLTTGRSQDQPCVVVLFNCSTNTELVRWSGVLSNGNAPTAVSWSTRGKQIAIATSNGDILQYSPTDPNAAKATVPRAQGPDITDCVPLRLQWLSNYTFHVVYAPPRPDSGMDEEYIPDQFNYIITYDKKANQAIDTSLPLPWEPYGLAREPGHQVVSLKHWGRFKQLCFINDAHATNVGIFGCIGDPASGDDSGVWSTISLGEESLTFPISSDMDDTSLIGMALDLSATNKLLGSSQVNGDDPAIPPAPIIYVYTNDAVIVGFHIVNEDGLPYPGMADASTASASVGGTEQGMDMATEKAGSGADSASGMETSKAATPMNTTTPGTPAFGFAAVPSASTSAQAPAFGKSGFGFGAVASSAPKFGSSGFGSAPAGPFSTFANQSNTTGPKLGFGAFASPAFGQSSFGTPNQGSTTTQPASSGSAFGSSGGGSGFAAFAGAKTAFGQPSTAPTTSPFGQPSIPASSPFGQASTSTPSPFAAAAAAAQKPPEQPAPQAPPAPAEQKATSPPASGSASSTVSPPASGFASTPNPFGSSTGFGFGSSSSTSNTTSAFKPAAGFGGFSGTKTEGTSAFFNPKPIDTQNKPLTTFAGVGSTQTPAAAQSGATKAPAFGAPTAFGQSTFGKPGQSAFGQSTFGQSAFGQSAFGQSPFAAKSPFAPTTPATTTTTGGSTGGGFSSFASGGSVGGFAALASKAEQAPSFLGPTKPKDAEPTAMEKEKPAEGASSIFGSNANVSKPGFGGTGLRDSSTKNEDEEEGSAQPKEKFPEEEMDKLEPVTKYEGPGLFPTLSKAPQDMRSLGLGDSKAESSKSAFGLVTTRESASGSAAAAFSIQPAAPTSAPTASQPKTSAPVSAFGAPPAAASKKVEESTTPKGKGKDESDEDEDEDGDEDESVLLDDDIDSYLREGDELLETHTFDEDEEEYESDEGDEDDNESLSEEEGEEGDEEEEEEDGSDLPDEEDESADEEAGRDGSPSKPSVPASTGAKSLAPLHNPFGKPKAAAPVTKVEPSSTTTKQTPVASTSKDGVPTALAPTTSVPRSTPSPAPGPARPQPISHPVGQPITEPPKPKPRPASPKAAFGSWVVPPKSATPIPDPSKLARPKTPPMLFGKPSTTSQAAQPKQPEVKSVTPPVPASQGPVAIQPIQPKHPEVQAGIDRILYEYSVVMHITTERAKGLHATFDAFKGTGPHLTPNETGEIPPQWDPQMFQRVKDGLRDADRLLSILAESTVELQQRIADVQSTTLRIDMKREEAGRFLQARQNPAFMEKLVKPRGLAPEQAETQMKLRKAMQRETARLEEVEETIQKLKRKVELFKSGKQISQKPLIESIHTSIKNLDYSLEDIQARIIALNERLDAVQPQVESQRMPLKSSARAAISRAPSLGPDAIAMTLEVFAGEVRMTKLRDLLAQSRTVATVTRPQTLETKNPTAAVRRSPFSGKPVILHELVAAPTSSHPPPSSADRSTSTPSTAAITPVASSQPPLPTRSATIDHTRRGQPNTGRNHSKAPQINRDGPAHTSDFNFGPPPPSSTVRLPTNFVSLSSFKGSKGI